MELGLRGGYRICVTMVIGAQNVGIRTDRVLLVMQEVQIEYHGSATMGSW